MKAVGASSGRWKRIRWAVRLTVLGGLLLWMKLVGFDGHFYYPDRKPYDRPEDFLLSYEDVSFTTRDGLRLHGWFLHAQGEARGVVVHFHGNAANVSAHVGLIEWLPRLGYHVLMFDYRGYGRSEGHVTRAGTIMDGHAAVDYALSRPEARESPLFAYGQSLGGAVAIVVAAERPELKAVVAESPFSSYCSIAARHGKRLLFFEWIGRALAAVTVSAGYDPVDVVRAIAPRPVMIIAAERDAICFPEEAQALYAAAGDPKSFWLVPGAEHLEIALEAHDELARRVGTFFAGATSAVTSRPAASGGAQPR